MLFTMKGCFNTDLVFLRFLIASLAALKLAVNFNKTSCRNKLACIPVIKQFFRSNDLLLKTGMERNQ